MPASAGARPRLRGRAAAAFTPLALGAVWLALIAGAACRPGQSATGVADRPAPGDGQTASPPLATAESTTVSALRLEVDDVVRVSRDVIEVRARLVNAGARPLAPPGELSASDAPGTFSGVALAERGGLKRSFVLRDAQGRPLCSGPVGPLAPGERRPVWARFPAPSGPDVVVLVPGFSTPEPVPVPPRE